MQLMTGTWIGALISADGLQETAFSLSQPGDVQDAHFQNGLVRDGLVQDGLVQDALVRDRLVHDTLGHDALAQQTLPPTMTIAGSAPTAMRLLEGARTALVALADAVPDPISGTVAQVLLDVRMLGDQLVGSWLRRDTNGVLLSRGTLFATRFAASRAAA